MRRRLLAAFEQSLRPCQPAAHRRHQRRVEEQVHRQTDGRTRGRDLITGLHAGGVGAFPCLDGHIEMAGRVGDVTEQRQIGRGQNVGGVRLHEQVEGLLPVTLGCCVACALDDASSSALAHRTPPESVTVTIRVTAVTVSLAHLCWRPESPCQ